MNIAGQGLHPFFCYFGGKWRIAQRYPRPRHTHIIEPFAGAAGYSTRYPHLQITLYDIDEVICGLWDYLINVSKDEICQLPSDVHHIDELHVCQEAKWLIGFWLNKASSTPRKSPSAWMRGGTRPNSYWGPVIKERIARQLNDIRHWKIYQVSYQHIDNENASWFIDPPYSGAPGRLYRQHAINYEHLSVWCTLQQGQVIVCERDGAQWLPFTPFFHARTNPGHRGKSYSPEVIWTNTTTISFLMNSQMDLLSSL